MRTRGSGKGVHTHWRVSVGWLIFILSLLLHFSAFSFSTTIFSFCGGERTPLRHHLISPSSLSLSQSSPFLLPVTVNARRRRSRRNLLLILVFHYYSPSLCVCVWSYSCDCRSLPLPLPCTSRPTTKVSFCSSSFYPFYVTQIAG